MLKASFTILLYAGLSWSAQILPFSTDGCSAYFDGFDKESKTEWFHCCFAHDIVYWIGGTSEERLNSDLELEACVENSSNSTNAYMMYLGVRFGGRPDTGLPWRWAYGYKSGRGYTAPSTSEKITILDQFPSVYESIKDYNELLSKEQIKHMTEAAKKIQNSLIPKSETP
ncbi:MAG: hypothetical protein CME67_08230 [Halobacteriovoraceae bacterium]|nr:hypothetical protein [Halobacteriovoraceae bacterium]